MADPVIADHYRALAIFGRTTGLPEDRVVNTWAFRNDLSAGTPDDVADNVRTTLDEFYQGITAAGSNPRANMADNLASLEYRVYDLGTAPPRVPIIRQSATWTAPSGAPLPGEVACCLSYYATVNQPRSRGRVYIGPLDEGASNTSGIFPRPDSSLVDGLVDRAEYLLGAPNNLTWVLISQADAAAKVITNGWVDNAFDTQRRRGVASDGRTVFPTP